MMSLDTLDRSLKNLISSDVILDDDAFIPTAISELLNDLLLEWEFAEEYRFHNLGIRQRILLHGPTGNGKTTIARHIAMKAKLPFVEVNSDMVIDSHIGTTGANIHNIFQKLKVPCVLFWDEVDSIGRKRSGGGAGAEQENDRMVNSILVNMEKMHHETIFIGATNRMDIMDSAFLRRFHEIIEIKAPTEQEKSSFLMQLHDKHSVGLGHLPGSIDDILAKESYNDMKMLFVSRVRAMLLDKVRLMHSEKQTNDATAYLDTSLPAALKEA